MTFFDLFSIFRFFFFVGGGFGISVFRLISGKKILKATWFGHAYCGLALGFPKDHLTRDSYVRCLLCKQDVTIASRGITLRALSGGQTPSAGLSNTLTKGSITA